MIDDKKIEEAAINKCGFISSKFYSGAHWAINEFLKDLWHPVSDKPRRYTPYLAQLLPASPFETSIPFETFSDSKLWERFSENSNITRWAYIDDLFPKK